MEALLVEFAELEERQAALRYLGQQSIDLGPEGRHGENAWNETSECIVECLS